jgi:hypothetical protein
MTIVKFPILKCKDCDAITVTKKLTDSGWEYVWINDDRTDPVNGWRCPKCVAGWEIIVSEHPQVLH